jgi:mannose-6-phosphate isomerase-like protein (cupin superfamily)
MIIRDIMQCGYRRVMDNSFLCELLHPYHSDGKVPFSVSIAHAMVRPGESTLPHRLKRSREIYYILSGEGIMHIDGESALVRFGQAIFIPPGAVQHIQNTGAFDLSFLAICDPPWTAEEEELVEIRR